MIARRVLSAPPAIDTGARGTRQGHMAMGAAIAIGTACALFWVTVANDLATRGLNINQLISQRQELTMQRAAARVALGIASDPRRLAERAARLGYGPPEEVAIVIATVDEGSVVASAPTSAMPDPDSPLALWLAGVSGGEDAARPWLARLMTVDRWQARGGAVEP